MSNVFAINFRREAYRREQAKTRRRAARLGLWVLYFGALGVVLGLYGLNLVSLSARLRLVERQIALLEQRPAGGQWRPGTAVTGQLDRYVRDPRQWRDRLARLPQVLPDNAQLKALEFNPDNVSGATDVKLVITGEMHGGTGGTRVDEVIAFVTRLARDSVFTAGYRNVRSLGTRAASDGGTEFTVECR